MADKARFKNLFVDLSFTSYKLILATSEHDKIIGKLLNVIDDLSLGVNDNIRQKILHHL